VPDGFELPLSLQFATPLSEPAAPLRHHENRLARGLVWLALGLLLLWPSSPPHRAMGLTLADLRDDPDLTPERFMRYFADFKFELGRDVRDPETFLARRAGDCDDFATLAARLLREKGYTTKLVVVFMPKDVHVVCYVSEARGYLDFNCRKNAKPLVFCDSGLATIATCVSDSFRTRWRTVSEFVYDKGARHFVSTEFR